MSDLFEKLACPRCSALSVVFHCKILSNCTWRVCTVCTPKPGYKVVFDDKQRYYLSRED